MLWVGVFALDLGYFRGVAAVLAWQRQAVARAAQLLRPSSRVTNGCVVAFTGPTKPHSGCVSGECRCAVALSITNFMLRFLNLGFWGAATVQGGCKVGLRQPLGIPWTGTATGLFGAR